MRISDWSSDVCSSDLEGDDRIDDANAGSAVGADDADPRPDMMPPPRQQAEHMAQIGLVGGLFQNTASDRDGGVAGEHDLVTRARDRQRLGLGQDRKSVV